MYKNSASRKNVRRLIRKLSRQTWVAIRWIIACNLDHRSRERGAGRRKRSVQFCLLGILRESLCFYTMYRSSTPALGPTGIHSSPLQYAYGIRSLKQFPQTIETTIEIWLRTSGSHYRFNTHHPLWIVAMYRDCTASIRRI